MEPVEVLTPQAAAGRLGVSRHVLLTRLASRELTPATVDGKPAVVVDKAFRRAEKATATAAA
jgi:hypothetical protein